MISHSKGTLTGGDSFDAGVIEAFNDLPSCKTALRDALAYQAAINEILEALRTSPTDAQPVFDAIVKCTASLCSAEFSAVARFDGELLHLVSVSNMSPEETEAYMSVFPRPPDRSFIMGRAFVDRVPVQVEDVTKDPNYDANTLATLQRAAPYRSYLGIPILCKNVPVGTIGLGRRRVEPFSEEQIALVKTFANQAVIAIENARLFAELQEKSETVQEQAAEIDRWNHQLEARVAEQVAELGRVSKLARFLSPKISALIMSGEADDPLKTRRAEITAVYVDLRGFTAFTETSDPEEVMGVLREYHVELGRAITAFDGTIEHFAGDGAMILFNAPLPVLDHELQAVRMCLQIRDSVGGLKSVWRKRGHELGLGAGIAGGYATIGTIGFDERLDYSAIGTVCNLAARLCGEARDGQILVSPRVHATIEALADCEPIGDLALKGFHRPVTTHNVLGMNPG
jgi:class 3 adenylate cyclase